MEYPYLYKGIVESNDDPLGLNRIKVRVGQVYGSSMEGIATKSIPWASPASPILCTTPVPVGTVVYVMFEQGNKLYPVYLGYMLKNKSRSQCYTCKWFMGCNRCKQWPEGIPEPILQNTFIHESLYDTNNESEYLYEPK